MEGTPNFVDRSKRTDCISSQGKGIGEGRPLLGGGNKAVGRYVLSLEDAELMAYDGRPDIQSLLLESYNEVAVKENSPALVVNTTAEVPDQTQNMFLHTHPDGRPKKLSEATTLEERSAIMKHSV
jgi:hypothetical protein